VATQDALHEFAARKSADDPRMSATQTMLLGLLTDCQFTAENAAGIGGDDDEPPKMRLVGD